MSGDSKCVDLGEDVGLPRLSRREYFAAMAMQGLLATGVRVQVGLTFEDLVNDFTSSAVRYADALLAELARKEPDAD